MKKLFGTDGMRGEAGVFPLDERTVKVVGYSLARQFKEKNGRDAYFVTGRDTRESGEMIERAFHAGAVSAGAQCRSAGVIPTPGVAYLAGVVADVDAGIVISASHNPFQDNGIKIFLPSGQKIDEATERQIEKDIEQDDLTDPAESAPFDRDFEIAFQTIYESHLRASFAAEAGAGLSYPVTPARPVRIVADCANGAASKYAPELLTSIGARTVAINFEPDGQNINLNCGSTHIEGLQQKVIETKADLGVAFDGDADRALFINSRGELVDGDAVLWIMAQSLQDKGELKNDLVVATVMSNLGLELALKSRGIALARTAVGDKYVLEELLKTGAAIGGEQSGHIIFPYHSLVGDGMLTMLFLLKALNEHGKTLEEMSEGFTRFPQVLLNVKVREKLPFENVPAIDAAAKKTEAELGDTGRLLLRYSGTENLARVMIEGKDQETIHRQAEHLIDIISRNLG